MRELTVKDEAGEDRRSQTFHKYEQIWVSSIKDFKQGDNIIRLYNHSFHTSSIETDLSFKGQF